MANDFSGDDNCVALFNFESGALTADSKGGNTLTDNGGVAEDLVNYKQGACAADFTPNDWFHITDGDLDAGFPLKNGDSTKKISVCFWVYFVTPTAFNAVVAKWNPAGGTRSIICGLNGPANRFSLLLGYDDGDQSEQLSDNTVVVGSGKWYHVGMTFQNSDKSWRIRIYDEDADTTTETTGNSTNNINVEDGDFEIGRYTSFGYINGLIDEVVIFKDILSASEIDEIKDGTYGTPITTLGLAGTIAGASGMSGAVGRTVINLMSIAGTIAGQSSVSASLGTRTATRLSLAGIITGISALSGYIIKKKSIAAYPASRSGTYDENKVWDEVTQTWGTDEDLLAQAGSRYRAQLVTIAKDLIYFEDFI